MPRFHTFGPVVYGAFASSSGGPVPFCPFRRKAGFLGGREQDDPVVLIGNVEYGFAGGQIGGDEQTYSARVHGFVALLGLLDEPGSYLFSAHAASDRDADRDAFWVHASGLERALQNLRSTRRDGQRHPGMLSKPLG